MNENVNMLTIYWCFSAEDLCKTNLLNKDKYYKTIVAKHYFCF